MSNLPDIDSFEVIKKYSAQLTETTYQKIQLEVVVETLRKQRDDLLREKTASQQKVAELQEQLTEYQKNDEPTVTVED